MVVACCSFLALGGGVWLLAVCCLDRWSYLDTDDWWFGSDFDDSAQTLMVAHRAGRGVYGGRGGSRLRLPFACRMCLASPLPSRSLFFWYVAGYLQVDRCHLPGSMVRGAVRVCTRGMYMLVGGFGVASSFVGEIVKSTIIVDTG